MIKYTRNNLQKLEEIFRDLGVTVRYEKGNFQSGYCIVFGKNIVIVNRFFDIEARTNTLIEILEQGHVAMTKLSGDHREWYEKMKKNLTKTV